MARLPEEVCYRLEIDPATEFDVMFQMAPMRLARIFHYLAKKKTDYVTISAKVNGGVDTVSFFKDVLPPWEDEGSTSGAASKEERQIMESLMSYNINFVHNEAEDEAEDSDCTHQMSCSHNADALQHNENETYIYIRHEWRTLLCMTCLHSLITMTCVLFKDASQVIMCLGRQKNVIMFTNREEQFSGFLIPNANHNHYSRSFREFVRGRCIMEFIGLEDQVAAANVGGGIENQGDELLANQRKLEEYDASFSMPARKLVQILMSLSLGNSSAVLVSIKKVNGRRKQVIFNKDIDPYWHEEGKGLTVEINASDQKDLDHMFIKMKDVIEESGICKSFCLTCLYKYVDVTCMEEPQATRVTMLLDQDESAATFLAHTFRGGEKRYYVVPTLRHAYYDRREREMARTQALRTLGELKAAECVKPKPKS